MSEAIYKACPRCGRPTPISALRCGCGHTYRTQFVDRTQMISAPLSHPGRRVPWELFAAVFAAVLIAGVFVTQKPKQWRFLENSKASADSLLSPSGPFRELPGDQEEAVILIKDGRLPGLGGPWLPRRR